MKDIKFSDIKNKWENLFIKIKNNEIWGNIVLTIYTPFCWQKCSFCNCFVRKWDKKVIDNYMDVFKRQVDLYKDIFKDHTFETIIISWWSPSVLWKENIIILFDLIYNNFNIAEDKYIIYEADLLFTNEEILSVLREKWVTNMTLWVQTINKSLLTSMKRFQDEDKIEKLFKLMKKYDFIVNLDLIYCIPWDNIESLKKSLKFVHSLKPEQINIYKYENSQSTDLYKSWINNFWKNHINNLKEATSTIYNYFKKKKWVITETIESYWGCDYRLISYFSNADDIDYNDWRQNSSVLNLWYWEKSYILWEMEYELFPTDKLGNLELVKENEILFSNVWELHNIKYSALRYFLIRFTSYISQEEFFDIFKLDINDILSLEIRLLQKLWKIIIEKDTKNLKFNFLNQDDLILYQRLLYKLYLQNEKNNSISTINKSM